MKVNLEVEVTLSQAIALFFKCLFTAPGYILGALIEDIIVYYRLISKGHSLKTASKIYSRVVNIRAVSAVRDYYGDRNISMRDVQLKFSSKSV